MKITKSILTKIIREEILREAYGREEFTEIRRLATPPGNKSLPNIKKAYSIAKKIKDPLLKEGAIEYIKEHFGVVAHKILKYSTTRFSKNLELNLDLSGENLRGYDISSMDFRSARGLARQRYKPKVKTVNFSEADLTGGKSDRNYFYFGNFNKAIMNDFTFMQTAFILSDLQSVELNNAKIELTSFRSTNLSGVKLKNAYLRAVGFGSEGGNTSDNITSLRGADLSGAEFSFVDFENCDASGANFAGANFDHHCKFENADLSGCNFSGVYAKGCTFYSNLSNVDFSNANVRGVDFRHSNLSNADFSNADIRGANFTGSNTEGVNFTGAKGFYRDSEGVRRGD